jgi:hypothetical protein
MGAAASAQATVARLSSLGEAKTTVVKSRPHTMPCRFDKLLRSNKVQNHVNQPQDTSPDGHKDRDARVRSEEAILFLFQHCGHKEGLRLGLVSKEFAFAYLACLVSTTFWMFPSVRGMVRLLHSC